MVPPIIILNYDPLLPWWLAPVLWLLGVACLWATRFGSTWGQKLGRRYFIFSSIVRPLGILLIGFGFLELSSPQKLPEPVEKFMGLALTLWPLWALGCLLWSRRLPLLLLVTVTIMGMIPPIIFIVPMIIFWLAFCFSVWAIFKLGLRQSFLYRKPGDPFVTDGPYAVVRHPQLFAAMTMTASAVFLFQDDYGGLNLFGAFNAFLFGVALWLVIRSEEKDLALELGERWTKYAAEVPRLLPNIDKRIWRSACKKCGIESDGKHQTCPACGEPKPRHFSYPTPAMGCLPPLLLPAILLIIATFPLTNGRVVYFEMRQWPWNRTDFLLQKIKGRENRFREENGRYADIHEPDFFPHTMPRSAFCTGKSIVEPRANFMGRQERIMNYARVACPLYSGFSDTGFTALAIGDLDRDPGLEIWYINDAMDEPVQLRDDRKATELKPLSPEDFKPGP